MPNWLVVTFLAIVFTAVMAGIQSLYWLYLTRQEQAQEELRRRLGNAADLQEVESLTRDKGGDAAASALGRTGENMRQALVGADSKMSVTQLLSYMLILAGLGAVVGGILFFPMGIAAAVIGYLPYFIVQQQAASRTSKLVEQLPDTLELMSRSLQAGLGLSDAFKLAAEEMPMPVAAEFGRVFEEVRFGRDYREAFGALILRNPGVFNLRLMVSSILLQRETGGNLIEILENIAETIRSRFAFQAKVRAMTSEAKFSAIVLGGLPFVVVLILLFVNPAYLNPLAHDPKGNIVLGYCFISYGMGLTVMRDLTNVKV